jgi:hypothetical protein
MNNYAQQFYILVDHLGSVKVNPANITRQEMHAANLIIRKPTSDSIHYSVVKDRFEAARKLFGITGLELTQQQADEIAVYHMSLALKYRRS